MSAESGNIGIRQGATSFSMTADVYKAKWELWKITGDKGPIRKI
jgi:hypothetical protein